MKSSSNGNYLTRLFRSLVAQPELPILAATVRARKPRPELGPNQLAWLDQKLGYYALYRKQASAPTGTTTHGGA